MAHQVREHGFSTLAIHAGQDADPATGATVVPIYATSTYTQAAPGQHKGYEYSRSGNPTRTALETCLAALEDGERGLASRYTDDSRPEGFASIITAKTKLVWIETPTNPLLQILDIAAIAELTHRAGALLAVDNTFASPYLQQPLHLGADLVVHSTTKYLGGHSDVVGGAVIGDKEIMGPIAFYQNAAGAV